MKLELYKEAVNIWKAAASKNAPDQLSFELEFYKKLLRFLQVGNYYYCIFNYTNNDLDFLSPEMGTLMGYAADEYNVPFIISKIHPEDLPFMLNHENRAVEFLTALPVEQLLKYKIMHDYRVQKKNGGYIRVLQQGIVIEHDETGGILRTLIVHTDITHLKPEGKPVLSFIGLEGEPSFIDVEAKKIFPVKKSLLTKREKQILLLLIDGKLSKQIGSELSISKHTVDRHRKNMIEKHNVSNTNELIAKALTQQWL